MNKEVMFSSKTDLWETPQDFFEKRSVFFTDGRRPQTGLDGCLLV